MPDAGAKAPSTEFFLGTVGAWSNATGVEITLDGESAAMTKRYKMMYMCRPLHSGARVVVMKQSGTYIVLGEIGLPNSWKSIYTVSSLSTTATTTQTIEKVNELVTATNSIINWMVTQGMLWTS